MNQDAIRKLQIVPGMFDTALFQRLLVAWAGIIISAILYCLLRSVVDSEYSYQTGATIKWAIIQWGAWPIILPACLYLIQVVARHLSLVTGLVASAAFAIVGTSIFASIMKIALVGGRSFYETSYHMAPIAAGTYLVFGIIVYWHLYPAAFDKSKPEIADTIVVNDATIELTVWKGQVQTKIDTILIEWARAARNYVEFHVGGKSYLMRASMAELEQLLPGHHFIRTHRSYLVNMNFVVGVAGGSTRSSVVLESGLKLPVGKTYRHSLLAAIRPDAAIA